MLQDSRTWNKIERASIESLSKEVLEANANEVASIVEEDAGPGSVEEAGVEDLALHESHLRIREPSVPVVKGGRDHQGLGDVRFVSVYAAEQDNR